MPRSCRPAAPFNSLLTESLRDSANNPLTYVNQPRDALAAQSVPEGLSLAIFGETVLAQDPDTWSWAAPQDIRYAKGNLLDVGTYSLTDDGTAFGVTSLDMSMDQPAGGGGLYYLIRSISCGSWQTDLGAQPNRDAAMP